MEDLDFDITGSGYLHTNDIEFRNARAAKIREMKYEQGKKFALMNQLGFAKDGDLKKGKWKHNNGKIIPFSIYIKLSYNGLTERLVSLGFDITERGMAQ